VKLKKARRRNRSWGKQWVSAALNNVKFDHKAMGEAYGLKFGHEAMDKDV
jgi:hypothetical protein